MIQSLHVAASAKNILELKLNSLYLYLLYSCIKFFYKWIFVVFSVYISQERLDLSD